MYEIGQLVIMIPNPLTLSLLYPYKSQYCSHICPLMWLWTTGERALTSLTLSLRLSNTSIYNFYFLGLRKSAGTMTKIPLTLNLVIGKLNELIWLNRNTKHKPNTLFIYSSFFFKSFFIVVEGYVCFVRRVGGFFCFFFNWFCIWWKFDYFFISFYPIGLISHNDSHFFLKFVSLSIKINLFLLWNTARKTVQEAFIFVGSVYLFV